jgi:phosphatidylglycerophosphatase A
MPNLPVPGTGRVNAGGPSRTEPAASLRPRDPAFLIATWFGSGLLPVAPATWGSLAALPFAFAIALTGGPLLLLAAAALLFVPGIWAAQRYAVAAGTRDPRPIVVDEVVGQWLSLSAVPADPLLYLIGFLLFRVLDIVKPFPADWIDRRTTGGLGVMGDDVVAGAYAALLLWLIAGWLA